MISFATARRSDCPKARGSIFRVLAATVFLIAASSAAQATLVGDAPTTASLRHDDSSTSLVDESVGRGHRDEANREPLPATAGWTLSGYDSGDNLARASVRPSEHRFAPNTARAAAGVADDALPAALRGGPANVDVYLGVSNGKPVYAGITNDLGRRAAQHGSRFDLLESVTSSSLTQGQARAIEEALFMRNPGFQNIRHPISPSHSWYGDALDWGNAWLRNNGF